MFVRVKTTPNSPRKSVQIVASIRKGDAVTQKIMRHVGIAMDDQELEQLKRLGESIIAKLENEARPSLFSPEEINKMKTTTKLNELNSDLKNFDVNLHNLKEEARVVEGIHDVYGALFEQLQLGHLFDEKKKRSGDIFKQVVLARLADPRSKLKTTELLQRSFGVRLDVNAIYRMMDHLDDTVIEKLKDTVYRQTLKLFGGSLDVVLFDVTTLYFESFDEDEFRKNGYSKDLKFNQPQIVLALMVTKEGLPIGYDVFSGDTYEGHVLIPCLKQLKDKYGVNRVIFVADSGLFNEENLKALTANEFEYVVGARLKNQKANLMKQILNAENYATISEDVRITEFNHEHGRLIVNYSATRARKDKHDRDKQIQKLEKKLKKKSNIKELITGYGTKKYLKVEGNGRLALNDVTIQEAESWDGLHGLITNAKEISTLEAIGFYKELWMIEEAFRLHKTDLSIRPVYHFKESRVKAHVAILFASFCLMKQLHYRVKLRYKQLSPERIKEELLSVQASVLYDKKTKFRYRLPSKLTTEADKIYTALDLARDLKPQIISA